MRYRSQSVAYSTSPSRWCCSACRWSSACLPRRSISAPTRSKPTCRSTSTKVIHTNLLIVWVLTGLHGRDLLAGARRVAHRAAQRQAGVHPARPLDARWASLPSSAICSATAPATSCSSNRCRIKLAIVVVMLMFLYNIGMTIWKSGRLTTTEGVLLPASRCAAVLYLPALFALRELHGRHLLPLVDDHLWVEGVWEMIQGGFLAYLLIRLSGADREVMEKWLYVIVGPGLHRRHPRHRAPLLLDRRARATGCRSAVSSARSSRSRSSAWPIYAYSAMRRSGLAHPNTLALHWTLGSAVFTAVRRRPARAWRTPGLQSTSGRTARSSPPMHGHAAFYGAYAMIVLADDHLRVAGDDRARPSRSGSRGRATGPSGCNSAGCSA